jgi:UDP-N-acetylglucosamine--N-acetylmuramyl-(pentapeptide) pyrophosphoryl-undecaprenol N-acetylglucosamine transferase
LNRRPEARIVFAGSEKSVDQHILGRHGFEQQRLPAASSAELRRNPFAFARTHWKARSAARRLVAQLHPVVCIGCGGYASIAPVLAARHARIPIVLLEQNVIPGRATTWLSRVADRVCVSFDETVPYLPRRANCTVTGNPVRAEIAALHGRPHDATARRTLLILGGSQGAHSLNGLVAGCVADNADLLRGWTILHQTGAADHPAIAARYAALPIQAAATPFIDDIAAAYQSTTLVVSRAGATTLAELACCGLPALLLPHRHAVRDHQRRNAELFSQRGAADIVLETGSSAHDGAVLARSLRHLLTATERHSEMSAAMRRLARPDAAQSVCDVIPP